MYSYIDEIESTHGTLNKFYQKIHNSPFIEKKPLIDILKKIKEEHIKTLSK